jgi:hypothetical protein
MYEQSSLLWKLIPTPLTSGHYQKERDHRQIPQLKQSCQKHLDSVKKG